jgi:hypothetical protein
VVTTNDKLEFVFAMARHGNSITLHNCKRIMRYAATMQRLAETACNRELTKREILKDEAMMAKIIEICAPSDIEPSFSGDPRGCVVKLAVPDGYTNDMGQEGICVPA